MNQLVVWDWNGTILADTQALMDAGNNVIRKFGGTPLSRRLYSAAFSFPTIDFYCNQGCDREALLNPESDKVLHEFYERRASKCRTRRGVRETLYWLKNREVDSVILSNHMQESITNQLHRLGLMEYFRDVLANTELGATQSGKNKIDRLADYLSHKAYNPEDALIIGDSPEDIEIGKTFGMGTIAITDGYFSTYRLRESNPDYTINTIRKVIEVVEDIIDIPS